MTHNVTKNLLKSGRYKIFRLFFILIFQGRDLNYFGLNTIINSYIQV